MGIHSQTVNELHPKYHNNIECERELLILVTLRKTVSTGAMNKVIPAILFFLIQEFNQGVSGYPGGAPYCSARPGHGRQDREATMVVERWGNSFLVNITASHRGLVVRADEPGSWLVGDGHRLLKDCITHESRQQKSGGIFLFTPENPQSAEPEFSGYLVTSYSQFSVLDQVLKTSHQSSGECSGE